jgi:hypothetical protein
MDRVDPTTADQLERRLAEIDRRLRGVAGVIGPADPVAVVVGSGASEGDGGAEPQIDILLERIGHLTAALETMAPGDIGELLVMRSLLADVSLVTVAFRWRVAAVARRLDTSAEHLGEARREVAASRERDRTPSS